MNDTNTISDLRFQEITPLAPRGLGGLIRDHFANGRIFAAVGPHGGLTKLSRWGHHPFGGEHFFQGDAESAWVKLFRLCARIGGERYYLTLNDTRLYPFGYGSRCEIAGVTLEHHLLLLPDTLALRARILQNPEHRPVQLELIHQEEITAIASGSRTWGEFAFEAAQNALIVSCRDGQPDSPEAGVTWIGVGGDTPLTVKRGFQPRSKYYLAGQPVHGNQGAFYVTFAESRDGLAERLAQLSNSVQEECDSLVADYERRLGARPQITIGSPPGEEPTPATPIKPRASPPLPVREGQGEKEPALTPPSLTGEGAGGRGSSPAVLNSAFGQYPELIQAMKLPDRPGATRANFSGYFVWGWDGMTPLLSSPLANEADYAAAIFRFFRDTLNPKTGIAHAFSPTFQTSLTAPFPAQCQYIASLYHYVAVTGDRALAAELFPLCRFILDRCREREVGITGLVTGSSFWPDFPQAMEEDGEDISAINNSLLYQALRSMDYIAQLVDDLGQAINCRAWAERLRESFQKYLYDEEQGYFISSCSSETLVPRKHYPGQAIYWITPFARELVSHAPGRIAAFMDAHLRSDKCLLTLPHWDTAWMADGNQLGSSFPTADYFYLGVHKLLGDPAGLEAWLGDVAWFWQTHTAPEAFTPEAENEATLGPDNPGGKQCQAVTCWYSNFYLGLAGMDLDHEGLTLTPWGDRPVSIRGLQLRGVSVDLTITGVGSHVGSLTLNGQPLPTGSRKIGWASLSREPTPATPIKPRSSPPLPVREGLSERAEAFAPSAPPSQGFIGVTGEGAGGRGSPPLTLHLVRSDQPPAHPVLLRADGLRIISHRVDGARLAAVIDGDISGEVVIGATPGAQVTVDGSPTSFAYDEATQSLTIPFPAEGAMEIEVHS